ncbi:MAG: DUF6273 domain-containing protein [Defluviitaleaceae bacterium]|nr:DUF6273 domain-containing protein [Defluviitaleaceae bacterium]
MKKLLYTILAGLAMLILAACGRDNATPNVQSTPEIDLLDIGDIINFGGIDWRVLNIQSDRTLVISQYILELRAFHDTLETTTWEHSDIRYYLNNEFINRFTPDEMERILQTTLNNKNNPWFSTEGGNDTTDKIFLLSLEELVRYFGDSGELANRRYEHSWGFADEYGVERVAYTLPDVELTKEWRYSPPSASFAWWLRSPGAINDDMIADNTPRATWGHVDRAYVFAGSFVAPEESGIVDVNGVYATKILGVRPALWLER